MSGFRSHPSQGRFCRPEGSGQGRPPLRPLVLALTLEPDAGG